MKLKGTRELTGTWADICYNATAAHAYKQAVSEHHSYVWLEERASELLREWGFDSGEDE
jgi:hypothetical protein